MAYLAAPMPPAPRQPQVPERAYAHDNRTVVADGNAVRTCTDGAGTAVAASTAAAAAMPVSSLPYPDSLYLCIDLKTFFASVECAARGLNPFTTNLIVADPTRGSGTICLAVTPALKKLGVKNRCRVYEIPKDIHYIQVMPRMQEYVNASARIYGIYQQFCAPCDIHVYSIDECFIYITPYLKRYNTTPEGFAHMLMRAVEQREHICATVGIGPNLFLAKVAMDVIAKKNNSHIAYLNEELFYQHMWHHRPLTDVWGIGPGIARRLKRYGIFNLQGIAHIKEDILYRELGTAAQTLINHAWGKDYCTIADIKSYTPKEHSYSSGQVLMRDYSAQEALVVLKEMIYELYLRLIKQADTCSIVQLSIGYARIRYNENERVSLAYVPQQSMQRKLSANTNARQQIETTLIELWNKLIMPNAKVRRITITFGGIRPLAEVQPQLFDATQHAIADFSLGKTTVAIKEKFGKNALIKGCSLLECATATTRNNQIGGHHA